MSRKDSLRILFITVVGVTFFAFFKNHLVSSAQDSPAYYDLVRTIDTFGIGLLNPTGLVFSPSNNALFVLASGKTPDGEITGTSLAQVGLYREDLVNLFEIPVSIPELANLVYDGKTNSLLFFNPSIAELVQIHSRDAQVYVPSAEQFTHFDLRALGIKQFKGTAFDPATGNLYLLDSVGPRIIRIKPHPEKGYSGASAVADGRVRYLDLSNQEWGELRAIAYHPGDEHLYLLGGSRRAIYKLAQNGQVVSFYDLSDQNLIDPVDMVFAPSGDPTDDPTIMNLYLTDRGSTTPQRRRNNRGQIVEISFTKPIVADTSPFRLPTSLVNTIDTSSWSPPSPDPAGLSYRESTHTLIVSDSEVNETQFFQGKNLFESTLGGELLVSYNTLYFTEEPTGLALDQDNPHFYFSDDNRNQIYELDPGFDKEIRTPDDIVRVIDTETFGSFDPEGVAYGQGMLFIVDGVGEEVYKLFPGENGIFDGVPPQGDDSVSSFDTTVIGAGDPEGIDFNFLSGTLFILSRGDELLLETTLDGALINTIDLAFFDPINPGGVALAPGSQDPDVMNLYIADRGVDNDIDPNENDGKIYEITYRSESIFSIFQDDFESGDLSAWSAFAGSDDLRVTTSAALTGDYGLEIVIDSNSPRYLVDETPDNEAIYRSRFRFDPNSISMQDFERHYLFSGFSGADPVFYLEFRRIPGSYLVRAMLRDDSGAFSFSDWQTLSDQPHSFKLIWQAASGPASDDGALSLDLDGAKIADLTGVDNDSQRIDTVYLGPWSGIDSGTRGSYFLDEFESYRNITSNEDVVVDFAANPTSGKTPLSVSFSNKSTPSDTTTVYLWTFGDGAASTLDDPIHTYTTHGTYTVTLTAFSSNNQDTLSQPQYIQVSPSELIFQDDFESGNLFAWSAFAGSDDLRVMPSAALMGDYGLEIAIDSNSPRYLVDETPSNEASYRGRFRFDPNSISMQDFERHYLFSGFSGADPVFYLEFRRIPGSYLVRVLLRDDSGAFSFSDWQTLSDQPHSFELFWQAASSPASDDGAFSLELDGTQIAELTGVDNDSQRIDTVYLGPWSGIDSGTHGTYFLDEFESYRDVGSPYPFEVYLPVSFSATSK